MPAATIQRKESENDTSKPPSWALVPIPRSPGETTGGIDSRALVPYPAPSQQPLPESSRNGQRSNPYIPNMDQGPFEYATNTDNTSTGLTFYFATQIINVTAPVISPYPCHCQVNLHQDDSGSPQIVVEEHEPHETDAESSASRSSSPRSPRSPRSRQKSRKPHLSIATSAPRFISSDSYIPTVLPKKRSPAMRASHEEVIDAFDGVEVTGPVSGLGRFAKPLINKYHTSGYVSEFQGSGERVLLLPATEGGARINTKTRRDLERLECEMFDISKYRGNTNHLTVLTWASDSHWGSITLFEVEVEELSRHSRNRGGTRTVQEEAVKIRPVTAMEDVPKGILVNMRLDQDVRKIVLEYSSSEGRYRWRSQVRPGPSYARILERIADEREGDMYSDGWTGEAQSPRGVRFKAERPVFSSEEEENTREDGTWNCESPSLKRGRRRERRYADGELERDCSESDEIPDRRHRPRPSTLLRVDDSFMDNGGDRSGNRGRRSTSRSRSRRGGRAETDPQTGILATIPQFMALIHANRSILEDIKSRTGTQAVEIDADGDSGGNHREGTVRCITLAEVPVGKRHAGRDVHVVVLMPNGPSWAEERMLWTDEDGELAELRQKEFSDVIGRGRRCSRASSQASSRSDGRKSPRNRESRSADGREPQRRTGGRRFRLNGARSPSPPRSARW